MTLSRCAALLKVQDQALLCPPFLVLDRTHPIVLGAARGSLTGANLYHRTPKSVSLPLVRVRLCCGQRSLHPVRDRRGHLLPRREHHRCLQVHTDARISCDLCTSFTESCADVRCAERATDSKVGARQNRRQLLPGFFVSSSTPSSDIPSARSAFTQHETKFSNGVRCREQSRKNFPRSRATRHAQRVLKVGNELPQQGASVFDGTQLFRARLVASELCCTVHCLGRVGADRLVLLRFLGCACRSLGKQGNDSETPFCALFG